MQRRWGEDPGRFAQGSPGLRGFEKALVIQRPCGGFEWGPLAISSYRSPEQSRAFIRHGYVVPACGQGGPQSRRAQPLPPPDAGFPCHRSAFDSIILNSIHNGLSHGFNHAPCGRNGIPRGYPRRVVSLSLPLKRTGCGRLVSLSDQRLRPGGSHPRECTAEGPQFSEYPITTIISNLFKHLPEFVTSPRSTIKVRPPDLAR